MSELNVSQIYQEALGFIAASDYIKTEISRNGTNLLSGAPVLTVNLSFACELFLKAIYKIKKSNYEKKHGLKNLYEGLPKEEKNKIEQKYKIECEEKLKGNNKLRLRNIDKCLNAYDNAFVEWRYYFELKDKSLCVSWIDFEILIHVLSEVVQSYLDNEEEGNI